MCCGCTVASLFQTSLISFFGQFDDQHATVALDGTQRTSAIHIRIANVMSLVPLIVYLITTLGHTTSRHVHRMPFSSRKRSSHFTTVIFKPSERRCAIQHVSDPISLNLPSPLKHHRFYQTNPIPHLTLSNTHRREHAWFLLVLQHATSL